jgi:hypothetical protein
MKLHLFVLMYVQIHIGLESWNDFSPKVGLYNICQPTISKLFDTRQAQSSLLKWAGQSADYYSFVKNTAEKFAYPNQSKTSGFEGLLGYSST